MQWSAEKNAGFSDENPWLALNPNYTEINVEEQEHRTDSVLSYYRKLIALRKDSEYKETFTYGRFIPEYTDEKKIFAFRRASETDGKEILVAANYGEEARTLKLDCADAKILLTNLDIREEMEKELREKQELTIPSCGAAVLCL